MTYRNLTPTVVSLAKSAILHQEQPSTSTHENVSRQSFRTRQYVNEHDKLKRKTMFFHGLDDICA